MHPLNNGCQALIPLGTPMAYPGPARHEPLAVELHNTLYVDRGAVADGLAGGAGLAAWLRAVGDRLPECAHGADGSGLPSSSRCATRSAPRCTPRWRASACPPRAGRDQRDAGRAPGSRVLSQARDGALRSRVDHHGADPADIALAAIAGDAVDLLAGPLPAQLRACGAPACVLVFVKDHPRRAWCSAACGNRARQARHYRRTHAGSYIPARERSRQPEPRERAVLEAGHGADAVAGEGEDDEPDPVAEPSAPRK